MALTESNMLPLGTLAPDFTLPNTMTDQEIRLYGEVGDAVFVVMVICNHCPYVIHVLPELRRLIPEYQDKGVLFFAISANDAAKYPDDAPIKMKELGLKEGFNFPYLYDESQEVVKAYDAACTPDFYVFGRERKLLYRGRLDASRPGNDHPLDGHDLRLALDTALNDQPPLEKQYPSAGCNIKWKG